MSDCLKVSELLRLIWVPSIIPCDFSTFFPRLLSYNFSFFGLSLLLTKSLRNLFSDSRGEMVEEMLGAGSF
jgi:hypothetical protein